MTKTLAHGHSSKSTQRELSNEYHHHDDRVKMDLKNICIDPCALDEISLSMGRV